VSAANAIDGGAVFTIRIPLTTEASNSENASEETPSEAGAPAQS